MRTLIVLCIALASSVAAAESVKLGNKAPATGDKWTDERTTTIKGTVDVQGKQIPLDQNVVERKRVEVLTVKDGVITKEKLTYEKMSEMTALEGKTYTLTAGEPVTVDPAGEADMVRKLERRFGKPDNIRAMVAGKSYEKGKVVEIKPTDVVGFIDDKGEITKFSLEYVGMDGKNAKFNLKMEANVKQKIPMKIALAGTVLVDPTTAEALAMDLTGKMTNDGGTAKLDATMTMNGKKSK